MESVPAVFVAESGIGTGIDKSLHNITAGLGASKMEGSPGNIKSLIHVHVGKVCLCWGGGGGLVGTLDLSKVLQLASLQSLTHSERKPQIYIPKRKSTSIVSSIVSSNWQHKFLYFHCKHISKTFVHTK